MNLLPWLLDWPPSRGSVVVFLLLTVFSVGTLVVFGGVTDDIARENVTVESANLSVRLNDEFEYPDVGTGTVQGCLASGTPGDRVSLTGDVTVGIPADTGSTADSSGDLSVVVSLARVAETTAAPVSGTGQVTVDIFWIFDDDETLSVGDSATVRIRVRRPDETLATATRTVTVENGSRSFEC